MPDDEYLTPAQVAADLHVTVVTVRRWINTGALPASKAGPRRWMVARRDLAVFLAGGEGASASLADASEDSSFRPYLVVPGER